MKKLNCNVNRYDVIAKRTAALLLSAVMLFSLMPASAFALEEDVSEPDVGEVLKVEGVEGAVVDSGNLTDNITWTVYDSGLLRISGTGSTGRNLSTKAFSQYIEQITALDIQEGITEIGPYSLSGLKNVQGTVTLPDSLTCITNGGLAGLGASKIVFGRGTQSIETVALASCKNLTEIVLPKNLSYVDETAFNNCTSLSSIKLDDSSYYKVVSNVLFTKDMKTLVLYPSGKTGSSYSVPAGVETILSMRNNPSLNSIVLPTGLKEIGEDAFENDDGLTSIQIPSTVESIGESAFGTCISLQSIVFPERITYLGKDALNQCSSLQRITIRSWDCRIDHINPPRNTEIRGYRESTAHDYAVAHGYKFVDIETGEALSSTLGNRDFLAALGTTGIVPSIPIASCTSYYSDQTHEIYSYEICESDMFKKETADRLAQVRDKTKEICTGKRTDLEKAKAIYEFIINRTWQKDTWPFFDLTKKYPLYNMVAAMLYYADIPNGLADAGPKIANLALCDGRWVIIDAVYRNFDDPDAYEEIVQVQLKNNNIAYVADDYSGFKINQLGQPKEKDPEIMKNGIDIPSWVTGYFRGWMRTYSGIEIRGTQGGIVEQIAKEMGYEEVIYSRGRIKIHKKKSDTKDPWILEDEELLEWEGTLNASIPAVKGVKVKGLKKKIKVSWKKVSKTNRSKFDSIEVQVSTNKSFRKPNSIRKTIKKTKKSAIVKSTSKLKLKKKKTYWVRVRAVKGNGLNKQVSKWSKPKKVKVR